MDDFQKKILDKLQAQCSRREYCRNDVYTKALKALEGGNIQVVFTDIRMPEMAMPMRKEISQLRFSLGMKRLSA